MKKIKRVILTFFTVFMLFSIVSVSVQAATISTTSKKYGYMAPTDAKIKKTVKTVKVYGNQDYINFYIDSCYDNMYFFYEIYSDKKMKKLVASDYTYCKIAGTYAWSPLIKLKGVFKTGTYYGVTYAAKIDDAGNAKVSKPSLVEFKLTVNRSPKFTQQMVILKSVTNTVNGPTVKWNKLSKSVSKYIVYRRSVTSTKWTKVATVKASKLSYTDKSIKDKNGQFVYTVKALDKKNNASRYLYNGLICLYAKTPKVSSVATTSDNRIQVKWNNVSKSAYYKVYRSENGGSWKLINKKFKGTTYYDATAKAGNNYKYTVKAVVPMSNGNATSSHYNVDKTVDFIPQPKISPIAVTDLGLKISWNKVEGAATYTVYRKTFDKDAKWQKIGTTKADVTEFIDVNANAESAFIYTVRSEGKTSRGSYSSKGVEYFTLKQPEFTTTLNEHIIHLEWESVKNAEGYYILNKNDEGEWSVYQTVTQGTECSIYIWKTHEKLQLTVQAFRGDVVSDFKEDVEVYDYWAKANAEYAIYSDVIYFTDYSGRYNTTYNLYRKLATQSDDEYKLISSDIAGSSGEWVYLSDGTEIEYDTEYVYQVRMSWFGVEQQSNIQTINLIKYSPEKYINSFNVTAKKENDNYIFYFDGTKKNEAKSFKESVYVNSTTFWANTQSSEKWIFDDWSYDIDNLRFGYVVSDEKGSTPIDGFVVDKSIK